MSIKNWWQRTDMGAGYGTNILKIQWRENKYDIDKNNWCNTEHISDTTNEKIQDIKRNKYKTNNRYTYRK